MNNHNKYFPELVGQEGVKKKLTFYLEAFEKTSQLPFLLMAGAKGLGKTEFAKALGGNLKDNEGDEIDFLEINCSVIKNNEYFFENVFLPHIADKQIVVFFDECHALPQDLTMAFLSIFNSEKNPSKVFEWDGMSFTFNFQQQHFIFATTETDRIFAPLKDRLTTIDFEPYSADELSEIVKICLPDIVFTDEALLSIASTIRGNARSAVKRAKEIMLYCGKYESNTFTSKDFCKLCDEVGILPYGLTYTEKQILHFLNNCGSATLTGIAAKLGLSKSALQRDHELYLLNKNLMEIDGKRKITCKGLEVCKELFNE
tara:strand:+ start:1321 stop:2265 length:945 start_codon:yes stop_codon:yes gene_type:complete